MPEMEIADIRIGKRHRDDLGNLRELADSIEKLGLLHPPVVRRHDKLLVVGERRVESFRLLGRTTIPVRFVEDLDDPAKFLAAECEENTCRKPFTPEEAVAIGESIEAMARDEARRRQQEGGKQGGETAGRGRATNRDGKTFPKPIRDEESRAMAKVAKVVGMSRPTYERAKAVVEAAKQDPSKRRILDEMNRTGKVSGAHKKLKVETQVAAIKAEPLPLPAGPFRVLAVDPPWSYDARASDPSHRASNPYPSLSIEEITNFRPVGGKSIPELAHDDAVLWLWTTNSHISEAFGIAEAWGFTYKTLLTWNKVNMGTDDWLRGVTEHCLMCVKGKAVVALTNQTTLIAEPRGEHSRKPDAFYDLVESLCPGSKVEIFSRMRRDGWVAYGDEAEAGAAA